LTASEIAIALRPATMEDAEMVFCWRNDPFIVARGTSQKPVTWDEHVRWLHETVTGGERKMWIVLVNGEPAGQVRFDRVNQGICAISAYLLQKFTGRGWGVEAIRQGCDRLFNEWPCEEIVACVREDNASARVGFRKAGFVETEAAGRFHAGHFVLVLRRSVRRGMEIGSL